MPRYGLNLEDCFENMNNRLSRRSTLNLGIKIIDILEKVHAAGYTYNDLKLDNLLIGYRDKLPKKYTPDNVFENVSVHLIDYGFATRYIDKHTGKHIEDTHVDVFRGNMIFASLNQL